MTSGTLSAAWLVVTTLVVGGCAAPSKTPRSWGPVVVEASPLPPRTPLEVVVLGALAADGDLERVLRSVVAEAKIGGTSSSIFQLSVDGRERVVAGGQAHVASLRYRLTRGGTLVAEDEIAASASTAAEARRLAVARLLTRASAALARQEAPRSGPAQGFDLPAIVVVERVAHSRDWLELSFVETTSGAVVRREIVPLADAAAGPPGRFVLSRRTVEGQRLDDEGYALLVRQTRDLLDLRPIGETGCLGYFGPRTEISPARPVSPPRTSTPPRR